MCFFSRFQVVKEVGGKTLRSPIGAARLLDAGFAGFFGLEINFGWFSGQISSRPHDRKPPKR